ncbi:MAG: hypothetical protein IT330_10300 [Anaerolineae bacterium]|nr:hypothetical protein [Anaerolineae bacterium]
MARRPMPTPDVIGQLMNKSRAKPEELPTRQIPTRVQAARVLEETRNQRYGKRAPFRLPDDLVNRLKARAEQEEVPLVGLAQWALRYGLDALESGQVALPKTPRGYKIKE